jgi:hypothetical protein
VSKRLCTSWTRMRWRHRPREDCWATSRACIHPLIRTEGRVTCLSSPPSPV